MRSPFRKARVALVLAGLAGPLVPSAALGLQCHVGTITHYDNGAIRSCEIEAHHRFVMTDGRGIVCRAGHLLAQHPDGKLQSCVLNEPYDDGAQSCPAGRIVILATEGSIIYCQ